ncbi:MAG: hypothetical protein ACE5GJ_11665 [Gemmatimonadota bacterium]
MKAVRLWLEGRTPSPPSTLARWLEEREPAPGAPEGEEVWRTLTAWGIAALDRARSHPGRVRESAFHLLAADALLTYACEAALETEEPTRALDEILKRMAAAA